MSQTRTHKLEGRKREEGIRELENMACHKGLTNWRGGRRSGLVSLETWHVRGLTDWRGWRRTRLVNLETWHIIEDSLTRGEEEGGAGWEARKRSKSQTTAQQLEGKGRSTFVSSETWHVTNKDSPTGREEEGGACWGA